MEDLGSPIHIHTTVCRGGDPATIIMKAIHARQHEYRRSGAFIASAILLDDDKRGLTPEKVDLALQAAAKANMIVIWQRPDHEGLLLRHLPGCAKLSPPTKVQVERRLLAVWPSYRKPRQAHELRQMISLDQVRQAAAVEAELEQFLKLIVPRQHL
jgi:hypothetical protein